MRREIKIAGEHHLETLGNCGGYYACPKDSDGKRLGPLVGYAGKYEGPDGKQLQLVGDVYANFAMAEPPPKIRRFFAGALSQRMDLRINLDKVDAFCGAPIGGYSLADAIGLYTDIPSIKAEKKVIAFATSTEREQSKLVFARHNIERGLHYVIAEDVCNNFSTTRELVKLIMSFGGQVVGIVCFLNRSLTVDSEYCLSLGDEANILTIPVVSLVRQPIDEWRQDDPAVADDVAKGNVVWKPKDEWDRLMKAMGDNPQ